MAIILGRGKKSGDMIVSAHQPAFLPWLGYFDKIARSDIFVFMDDVQFEKNSFTNRNKIKTDRGPLWLTVPVKTKGHLLDTMLTMPIGSDDRWKRKHLSSIAQAYRHAPHFGECFSKLEDLYSICDTTLVSLCYRHLLFWLNLLAIRTRIVRMSDLVPAGRKSDLVLDLCRRLDATRYISGIQGRNYLELEKFRAASIAVEFQDYTHPVYPQLHGKFAPNLSVLDAWMMLGTGIVDLYRS